MTAGPFRNINLRGPFVSAGSEVFPWTLLTTTTQGIAPLDSTTMGDTGTGFTDTTGIFRVVTTTHTTAVDGFRENLLRWDVPLSTLFPDFTPDTYGIELLVDFNSPGQLTHPGATNTGLGIYVGVQDCDVADIANMQANITGTQLVGSGVFQGTIVTNSTASGATTSLTPVVYHHMLSNWQLNATNSSYVVSRTISHRGTSGGNQIWTQQALSNAVAMRSTFANWRLCTGIYHVGTTDFTGLDIRWRVWFRFVERGLVLPA